VGFCAALFAVVLMAPPAARCARTTLDKTALVVNQDVVTENELEEAIAAYFAAQGRQTPPPSGADYKKVRNEIIDTVINELLMSQAADSMGVSIADEDLDRQVDQQIEGIRKHFATKKELQTALALEGITEDDLRAENHRKILRQMKAQRAKTSLPRMRLRRASTRAPLILTMPNFRSSCSACRRGRKRVTRRS
jgi:peptidyl-prolyl cis-trans isomerase SurA